MKQAFDFFVALYKAGSFDTCVNGVGQFALSHEDWDRFDVLRGFSHVFVSRMGNGYHVEVA